MLVHDALPDVLFSDPTLGAIPAVCNLATYYFTNLGVSSELNEVI